MFNKTSLLLALVVSFHAAAAFNKDPRVVTCLDKRHLPPSKVDAVGSAPFDSSKLKAPSCAQGSMKDFKRALINQITACKRPGANPQSIFRFGCRDVKMQSYCLDTASNLLQLADSYGDDLASLMQEVWKNYDLYRLNGDAHSGKMGFTGYNTPLGSEIQAFENVGAIPASEEPMQVLAPPVNLVEIQDSSPANCGTERNSGKAIKWCLETPAGLQPVPTSEDIRNGALNGKAAVLGYMSLKDYLYLNLEGAGQVRYTHAGGSVDHIIANFAGRNGQQGNLLSSIVTCMKSIYGDSKPPSKTAEQYLQWVGISLSDATKYNESHTFWDLGGSDYLGVDQIPLIRDHVMATDPEVIPTGSVSLIQPAKGNGPCALIMTASDVGSAIKGARADLYMGLGPAAAKRSNKITGDGEAYMILPKGAGTPVPGCHL